VGTRELKKEKRPLSRSLLGSGGSDGRGSSSYNMIYIPPKTPLEEAMRLINHFVVTGEIDY
jgi:hypothetical protein